MRAMRIVTEYLQKLIEKQFADCTIAWLRL